MIVLTPHFWGAFRFWTKVDFSGECWNWTGNTIRPGSYGRLRSRGVSVLAHRFAYTRTVGKIPDGLQLDHLCRNKICVNPSHLEPVTNDENHRRAVPFHPLTNRAHCPKGHAYSQENTRMYRGSRHCRECGRRASQAWKVRVGY